MAIHHLLFGSETLILLATLFVGYFISKWAYNIWFHPLAKYPGPVFARASNIPLVWNLVRGTQCIWTKDLHKQYGGVVRCGPNDLSYATEEGWRDIYVADKMYGQKWQGFYSPENPQFQNIMGVDNVSHAELRKIFNPAFSERSLRDWEHMFKKVTSQMVDRLKRYASEETKPIDMGRFFMYVTFDIMGEFTLDAPLGMVDRMEFLDWIAGQYKNMKVTALMASAAYMTFLQPLVAAFSWLMLEQMSAPLRFAIEQVDKRMSRPDPEAGSDIWSLTFKESKSGRKLSRREMHTHALLLFTAGTETSATAMTGLLYYLSKHPEIDAKLKKEIRSKFNSPDEIDLQRCSELPYLQACIEEVLRIYPPIKIGFPRITPPEGAMIDGQYVAGGTVVYITQFASNLLPSNWKNAEDFIPERWLAGNLEYADDKRGARQPFSCGPRNCIGISFAYHEMRLIVAELLYSFDLDLCPESDGWDEGQKTYVLNDKVPLWMKLKPLK